MKILRPLLAALSLVSALHAEPTEVPSFKSLFNGKDLTGWRDVNTSEKTWSVRDGLLVCTGHPTGVMRSEKQYESFLLHIECVSPQDARLDRAVGRRGSVRSGHGTERRREQRSGRNYE